MKMVRITLAVYLPAEDSSDEELRAAEGYTLETVALATKAGLAAEYVADVDDLAVQPLSYEVVERTVFDSEGRRVR